MTDDLRIVFEPLPSQDLSQFLEDNVINYSIAQTGMSEWHPVGYFLRNERGEWLGGCMGFVWGGWLQVRYLWVSETLRGRGHGAALLAASEQFAADHGAAGTTLETHSFQALEFYVKRGYRVFGTLDNYPPGHSKFFLRKMLS